MEIKIKKLEGGFRPFSIEATNIIKVKCERDYKILKELKKEPDYGCPLHLNCNDCPIGIDLTVCNREIRKKILSKIDLNKMEVIK